MLEETCSLRKAQGKSGVVESIPDFELKFSALVSSQCF